MLKSYIKREVKEEYVDQKPPKKLLKCNEKIDPKDKLKRHSQNDYKNFELNNCKYLDKNPDNCNTNQTKNLTFDCVLQELFSWNPEWLQGRAINKPPFKKFENQMKKNEYKLDYNREEYISRHLPYIQSELFIQLSDSFKNEAPSRTQHYMFINDCDNSGDLGLNKVLVCYSIRDIRKYVKPVAKVDDIVILSLEVIQTNTSIKQLNRKLYFGLITGHSMLELSELDSEIMEKFVKQTLLDPISRGNLLCDKLVILTKRSRESTIVCKRISRIEVIINGSIELRQIENLLYDKWKCTKLLSNIFNANANIHQFSAQELNDFRSVRKMLSQNAIDMITKSNPMVFYKGVHNLMVVDISDESQRLKYLCDIVIECLESFNGTKAKTRFLVITKTEEKSICWRERIRNVCGLTSSVKVWSLASGRGWVFHKDVLRSVEEDAQLICESCGSKLRNLKESQTQLYKELTQRRDTYKKIAQTGSYSKTPAIVIAREELLNKGYERLLKENNVIIGTLDTIIKCRHLFKENTEPFDCCIIDDSHTLPEINILSLIHFGIKSLIIGGDSEGSVVGSNPFAVDYKYNISLFNRILSKYMKSM